MLLHLQLELREGLDKTLNEVVAAAQMHGVGIVTFEDPAVYDTWKVLVDAQRFEPGPERLNNFVDKQLSSKTKASIARALR